MMDRGVPPGWAVVVAHTLLSGLEGRLLITPESLRG